MRFPFQAAVILATILWPFATLAEVVPEYPEFTFRRLKPPGGEAEKRITVQIDPNEVSWVDKVSAYNEALPPLPQILPDTGPGIEGSGDYEWFWTLVSPAAGADPAAHFQAAMAVINAPPEGESVATPRLQRLQGISETYGATILESTVGTRVSPALVLALISVESGGSADALSPAGAQGLMQLIPATAERFGVEDSTDPVQNIKGGVAYLDWLMEKFDNNVILVLAAYNAGENAVTTNGGVPPYPETRGYVPKVLSAWQVARALCLTMPELPTDGCVFTMGRTAAND